MKRFIPFFLISILTLSLFGCSGSEQQQCDHKWTEANCKRPKTCSVCNEVNGEKGEHQPSEATCTEASICSVCMQEVTPPLGHTAESGFCERCKETIGDWSLSDDSATISAIVFGTFSNSATKNSDLIAALTFTDKSAFFTLWEYNSDNIVSCNYGYDDYSIKVTDTTGKTYYLDGAMYKDYDFIHLDSSDSATLLKIAKQTGIIKFHIVNEDSTSSKYDFSINTGNFNELYYDLK